MLTTNWFTLGKFWSSYLVDGWSQDS